jgi:hypothetical protein
VPFKFSLRHCTKDAARALERQRLREIFGRDGAGVSFEEDEDETGLAILLPGDNGCGDDVNAAATAANIAQPDAAAGGGGDDFWGDAASEISGGDDDGKEAEETEEERLHREDEERERAYHERREEERRGARSKLELWAKAGVDFGVYRKAASTAPNPLAEVVEKAVVARRLSVSVDKFRGTRAGAGALALSSTEQPSSSSSSAAAAAGALAVVPRMSTASFGVLNSQGGESDDAAAASVSEAASLALVVGLHSLPGMSDLFTQTIPAVIN